MSNMKCPFCRQELEINDLDVQLLGCENQNCKHSIHYDITGTKELWQELIRTRKALEIAVDALKSAKTRFERINNSKFANLNNVLQIQSQCEILKINEAIEQITAEQKDVK